VPQRLNRRAFLRRLLLATGSVALSGCTRDLLPQAGGSVALTLLHLNDLHGALRSRSPCSTSTTFTARSMPGLLMGMGVAVQRTWWV